jgi:signal transduction histidine kinase
VALALDAAGAPPFRGDAEDLAEMVGALAENAVTHARSAVRLAARGAGTRLVVEVADDGPGIPEAERARLLARGARLDEGAPGYGLGLAIVADRAALYGGGLDLTTSPLGGLLARLTLPAVRAGPG